MKKNTKIIRLTENDLERMVQKIIKESNNSGSIEDYFSKEELAEIKENATRLLSPQFFEDYEVTNYISTVSGNDKKVERMLVNWLKSEGLEFYQPEYRSDTGYFDYMEDETSTPIKPVTIHGKTYKFVEDLPIRELGIGSYVIQDGIVMVDGDTPLQDWLDNVMGGMEGDEDYMSSEEDLINAAYELMYDLGYEYVEDLYIQDLQDAANILEDELYEGNHGSIMNEKIEDLLTNIYEIIGYPDAEEYEMDEDYMEEMPKPGMFHKLKQGLRDLSGIGNKNDNATLKQIHALIVKGAVDNVRRQPNGITAWVNNKALILDIEMPEIIYAGRNLEVANLESKVLDLYSELLDFI